MNYPEKAREFAKQFWPLADAAASIMVTGHERPDDDSIGSVMAMYEILHAKYPEKKVAIWYPGERLDQRWTSFSTFKEIKIAKDINAAVLHHDLILFLDGSEYVRFFTPDRQEFGGRVTVCIDHHRNAPDSFTLSFIEPNATSVSELIYYAFCENESKLLQTVIESLLLGIFGDTLMFDWIGPDQTPVFAAAARLVREGIIVSNQFRGRYDTYSERVFEVIQEYMRNAKVVRVGSWPACMTTFVSRNFVSQGAYSDEDVSAAGHKFINSYGRAVLGVLWGFLVSPRADEIVQVNARSKPGGANVRLLLEGIGVGSGHDCASGGKFKPPGPRDPERRLEEILVWMETHEPVMVE